jgi:putative nucleotidyltransferase with HDIG domain
MAASRFEVETSPSPIGATISIGVASYPADGGGAQELIHQADLAVYSAKLQGRNRTVAASAESLLLGGGPRPLRIVPPRDEDTPQEAHVPAGSPVIAPARDPAAPAAQVSFRLAALGASVTLAGLAAGVGGMLLGPSVDLLAMLVLLVLVVAGRALALDGDERAISVSAVGVLAGAALFGVSTALPLALAIVIVDWSARGTPLRRVLFDAGALTLAALAAAGIFTVSGGSPVSLVVAGVAAGTAYFLVHAGLRSRVLAAERGEAWRVVFRERFLWLLPHYAVYGFIGSVMATAYAAAGVYALAIFTVPLLLMRRTQAAYLSDARHATRSLRAAAETIQGQNASLEHANRLLRERSAAAMETLSATVEARDANTTGHSRRVRQLSLAIGRELDLSQPELDLLAHAALFHDIGNLAVPDAILLKPASLSDSEWNLVRGHAEEGARIIDQLGFLGDAVPAIKHHHERFDGAGYPDGLTGEEIPLGARIILVADALDSMLTSHVYRGARPAEEAIAELRRGAGTQFCPRCVDALEGALAVRPTAPTV